MKAVFICLALVYFTFAVECNPSINMEQAINAAKQFVGEVHSVKLRKSYKTGECYYSVSGSQGSAIIDANTGKLVRFYSKKGR
ncbi:PepSY domain-containing protein [Thermocrinis minervae]|uniref:Peptidase propeptide and YPEB domain-containing protein n=1 Tax=Thermocrinis minervae TaxID=381751 RepID=A0A1M6T0Z9_9AQUI|nr:PepSY domain-containing protein [Thermocrinis minervae]SHK50560.1 hypothetical protein SAMN05444391_1250 [Thermocrinis minervae]